jgi:serine/threonine protein kinase
VHRDIKLDNILIKNIENNEFNVKLADFGLATKLPKDGSKIYEICGSPFYIAPELLRGKGTRELCDIFSLGSVLFNLLTGRYLFNGDTRNEIL